MVASGPLQKSAVAQFIGQYWYPIHYFPTFLARVIAVAPRTDAQTIVSRILWQELGEGDPKRSHEDLYIQTMIDAGFARGEFVDITQFESTRTLVASYEQASSRYLDGIGWLYGTEVIDLPIVVGLGKAVSKVSGNTKLPWVVIHAKQEPEHVANANEAVALTFSRSEEETVLAAAEDSWRKWHALFDDLQRVVSSR